MLPNEEQIVDEIREQLEQELRVSLSFVQLASEILSREPSAISIDTAVPYRVGTEICVNAIKLFRQITLLSQNGGGRIDTLARSLFESFVAIRFVLDRDFKLNVKDVDDDQLTRDFRAKLYSRQQRNSPLRPLGKTADLTRV